MRRRGPTWPGPDRGRRVLGLQPPALGGLSGSERTAGLPRAFGRSEWAETQLGAGVVTRGRGRTPRASRGGFVSRTLPGTRRGRWGRRPGPWRRLAGSPSAEKFPGVLLTVFQLVLKEPSPTLHLLPLWPAERRSGPRFPAPGTRASLVRVFPSAAPAASSPGVDPSVRRPRASSVWVFPTPILACLKVSVLFLVPKNPWFESSGP